jgi:hypothetical protein
MKKLITLLLLLTPLFSEASWTIAPFTPELRFEKGSDANIQQSVGWGLTVGWSRGDLGVNAEFIRAQNRTGNESFLVEKDHEEARLVGSYDIYKKNVADSTLAFQLTGGGGYFRDRIASRVLDVEDRALTAWKPLLILGTGVEYVISSSGSENFVLGSEFRLVSLTSTLSNPYAVLLLKAGVQF